MSRSERTSSQLRVLIVDQHEVSRAAIGALLRTEGLDVIADVSDRERACTLGRDTSPDIAIVDIGTDPLGAVETAGALARLPSLPTVVLTSSTPVEGNLDGYPFISKPDLCAGQLRLAMRTHHDQAQEALMSLQAYLDNITAKTGKTPEEFVELARAEGLLVPGVKAGQIVAWLKDEYGLGHGHSMAIVSTIKKHTGSERSDDDKIAGHFTGKKAGWRPVYDELIAKVSAFGSDTDVDAGASYLSVRKAGKKFAIVQVTSDRLDVGVKLNGTPPDGRLERAGSWNSMVTHRVRIHRPEDIDRELLGWLKRAYASA